MDNAGIYRAYVRCALWSSIDENDEPLDATYDIDDVAPDAQETMQSEIDDFVESNVALLSESGLSDEQIGHDFWLTRNRHGAGFWDRGLGAIGDKLTAAAHVYGEVYMYVGDDNMIHA